MSFRSLSLAFRATKEVWGQFHMGPKWDFYQSVSSFWPGPNLATRLPQEGFGPVLSGAKMKFLSIHVFILAPLFLACNYLKTFFMCLGPNICGSRLQNILRIISILPQVILAPENLLNFGAKLQIRSIVIVNLAPFIFGPSGAKFSWG